MKALRIVRNMVQEALGKAVGITTQQIQKYEKGHNRISASRLYEFANTLNVGISYFFSGYTSEKDNYITSSNVMESNQEFHDIEFSNKETLKLVTAFHLIKDQEVRKKILALISILAQNNDQGSKDYGAMDNNNDAASVG